METQSREEPDPVVLASVQQADSNFDNKEKPCMQPAPVDFSISLNLFSPPKYQILL
jgi:hypothetical protein